MMKAAVCREFGKPLRIEEVRLALPEAGELLVKVEACAICHSDLTYMDGGWGGELPAVFGHEAAGVIERIGSEVDGFSVGDHVVVTLIRHCGGCHYCERGEPYLCEGSVPLDDASPLSSEDDEILQQGLRTGAFAEYVTVHRSQAVQIPQSLPLDSASLLACGVITGLGAVTNSADIPAGCNVAVIGAGGVGLNSIQGAALRKAGRVIALDMAEAKLEASRQFGATHTVNAGEGDAAERVREITDGRGADYVFVTVGSGKAMEQGLGMLAKSGSLVVVGMPPIGDNMTVDPSDFASAGQHMVGSKMGSSRPASDIPELADLYLAGNLKLDELISGRYPLDEINEAIASVKRGGALRNVIVFTQGGGDEDHGF